MSREKSVVTTNGCVYTMESTGLARSRPRSRPRRMSPSVTVPTSTMSSETMSAICRPVSFSDRTTASIVPSRRTVARRHCATESGILLLRERRTLDVVKVLDEKAGTLCHTQHADDFVGTSALAVWIANLR